MGFVPRFPPIPLAGLWQAAACPRARLIVWEGKENPFGVLSRSLGRPRALCCCHLTAASTQGQNLGLGRQQDEEGPWLCLFSFGRAVLRPRSLTLRFQKPSCVGTSRWPHRCRDSSSGATSSRFGAGAGTGSSCARTVRCSAGMLQHLAWVQAAPVPPALIRAPRQGFEAAALGASPAPPYKPSPEPRPALPQFPQAFCSRSPEARRSSQAGRC